MGKNRPGLESDMIVVRIKKKDKSGKGWSTSGNFRFDRGVPPEQSGYFGKRGAGGSAQ